MACQFSDIKSGILPAGVLHRGSVKPKSEESISMNKPRMSYVVEAVIALCLSLSPHGFTAWELARQVRVLSNQGESEYEARSVVVGISAIINACTGPIISPASAARIVHPRIRCVDLSIVAFKRPSIWPVVLARGTASSF